MGDIKPKTAAPVAEDIQKIWRQNQAVPGGVERCIHDLFVEQAEARPDAPAICAWDGELTYGELDALSTKLAGHLVELGVKEEDMVPLCFEKSMWTVVAMLAVLKAGGAFVPLDPDHPRSRHEEILEQTKASLVLTSAHHVSLWAGSSLTVVTVSKASIVPLKDKVNLASTATSPRDAAYVMFTSGSTGRPKGVVVEHHALATSCLEQGRAFGLSAHTKTLQFASYTFDACITEIIAALMFGACVCVPSGEDRGNDLAKAINTLGVNWLLLTPTVARLLQPSSTPLVKTVVLGGEQVNYDDCSRWQGHVQVITCYGPTECSVWCSTCTGNEGFKSGTIGKSIASVSWVVDAGNHEQLAPVGSVGELLVEGPILARGYLNDAEKTGAAFISDPTWLLQGGDGYPGRHGRLYKTGDLVRYDTDGNLVYVGRKDDQVKVRGQRVELGDVEHHLRECMPEAQQIAVEVILLEGGEKDNATLAAFLQLDDEARGGPSANGSGESDSLARVVFLREVEEKMLGRLPGHMVPTVYFAVTELSMTTSGKTDRKRLREIGASFSAQQLAEPRTASEGAKRAPSTEAYWQTALADCEATLFPALPPAVQQPVAEATVHYQCAPLPKTASDTTTSTLVRAAWAILASRYTSSDDVVFGATVTGRNAPVAGIEAMLGPTIATVPVRVRIERDQTVLAFLEGVQKQATEMIAYEQTGLQHISKMGAGAQHACSFQTLLVVQPADDGLAGDSALGEWRGGSELQGFTTYGLVVQCTLAAEGVGITASFDERIIERWLVERMLGQLSFVMQQLAAAEHETTTVGSIDTLTPEDKQQLWEWNSEVPAAVERCVHDLFVEQAQARPDAPAICAWDGELTYGELDALSTKLAGHLVELGVKAEDMVPLCFEKSMWTVVAMLAVLKAGGAFVPLDPEHPESRHQEVFQQTAATVVLTSPRYSTLWASSARNIVTVDDILTKMLSGQILTRSKTTEPSNAAYVIFTSGSTGQPKGVVLEHRAVSTSCLSHRKAFRFTSQTRALQFASYTFDACITEIVTTLVFGGCVCVPSEDDRRNGLASVINSLSVNWSLLTPSVARLLNPSIVPTLKVLVMGGEQVLLSDWETWAGTVETVNAYGPAECCVCCTVYTDVQSFKSGAIGKSVASASWVMVSDNHNQLAPVGSVGELLVEGPILARGYLNDAEKTRTAFIEDPAWLVEGGDGCPGRRGRLYKTGDLVRYDADGNLVYVGRKDSQVKVRGQRVELGEVEHHLRACMPEAKRVAVEVVLPTGEEANATLAAFLQLEDESQGTPSTNGLYNTELLAQVLFPRDVEEKMLRKLPGHMVPTVYFAVAELPMTTSGKTDKKRLREIGASFSAQQLAELQTASEGAKRAPSTEAERTMQRLWAQVLSIAPDSIGLDDNFFRLGGDSITAMKLVGEARRHGLRLSSAQVFRHPTLAQTSLAGVASLNSSPQSVAPFSLLPPTTKDDILCQSILLRGSIQQQEVADILPTTHVQRVFINRGIESPREAFNYLFFDTGPELDAQLLRDSCRRLLDHFPILRSQFITFREKLWQVVLLRPQLPFITFETNGSLSEATRSICLEDMDKTDPLGLPTCFMLVRNKSISYRLIVRLSHAQYDGVCIPVIFRTLTALYMQESPPIAPSFPTYLAHARTQREASTRYWRELLKGSHLTRATARLHPKVGEEPALRNIEVERVIPAPQLPHNITMASLLSSAWALVLSSITGEEDVVYGHTVAGRNSDIPGIAEIVGPCLNVVPVRVRIQSAETPADLIRSVHEQFASLGEADLAQLDEIIHDCTDWPAGSEFDTMVQHQNIDEHPEVCFAGETTKLQWFDKPFGMARQLYFLSHPQADQLKLTVGGNTHILTVEAAHSILDVLAATVAELSRNIDGPLISCRFSFPLCISTC